MDRWVAGGVLDMAALPSAQRAARAARAAARTDAGDATAAAAAYATVLAETASSTTKRKKRSMDAAAGRRPASVPTPRGDIAAAADGPASPLWCAACGRVRAEATEAEHVRSIGHQVELQSATRDHPQYGVRPENIGFRLLEQSGWTRDQGLGRDGQVHALEQGPARPPNPLPRELTPWPGSCAFNLSTGPQGAGPDTDQERPARARQRAAEPQGGHARCRGACRTSQRPARHDQRTDGGRGQAARSERCHPVSRCRPRRRKQRGLPPGAGLATRHAALHEHMKSHNPTNNVAGRISYMPTSPTSSTSQPGWRGPPTTTPLSPAVLGQNRTCHWCQSCPIRTSLPTAPMSILLCLNRQPPRPDPSKCPGSVE